MHFQLTDLSKSVKILLNGAILVFTIVLLLDLLNVLCEARSEEVLDRLINDQLSSSLHGTAHIAGVEELDTVLRVDGDSKAVSLSLVERLLQTAVVVEEESAVLH